MITDININVKLIAQDARDFEIMTYTDDEKQPTLNESVWILERAIELLKEHKYNNPHHVNG